MSQIERASMQAQLRQSSVALPRVAPLAFGTLVVLALVIRVLLFQIQTSDYTNFVSQWYAYLAQNGGFPGLKGTFSNYNPPYLYLLAVATYLPISKIVAIKSISVIFDVLISALAFLILRRLSQRPIVPYLGALFALYAPTIIINGAAWGQCDAIYASFCLASLYSLLKGKSLWGAIFFGLALAFKLQAIFFLPVLVYFFIRMRPPIWHAVFIPIVFGVLLLPSLAAGRSAQSLLSIYVSQVQTGGVGGAGGRGQAGFGTRFPGRVPGAGGAPARVSPTGAAAIPPGGFGNSAGGGPGAGFPPPGGAGAFTPPAGFRGFKRSGGFGQGYTYNAPSIYQWLPAEASPAVLWKGLGVALAGLFVAGLAVLAYMRRAMLTPELMIKFAMVTVLAVPFFLPDMHERYFYLADVLSIIYACCSPRYFFVPILMQAVSLLSYIPYLLGNIQVPYLPLVSGLAFALVVITTTDLLATLFPHRAIAAPLQRLKLTADMG